MKITTVILLSMVFASSALQVSASGNAVVVDGLSFTKERNTLQLRSTATATWMKFIDVYVAAIYTRRNSHPDRILSDSEPLSLDIGYLMEVDRQKIIKAAETALSRQHDANRLSQFRRQLEELHSYYSDVSAGDHYRIDFKPGDGLRLSLNSREIVHINDDDFALFYLGIWLDKRPLSEPLRTALLDWSDS